MNLKTIIAIILILAFRASVFEPYKIPTGSMIPTMLIGDFILVNKYKYGFKLPFSHVFKEDPIYLTGPHPVKHGDIIVFKYPHQTSINYVKRVVGIPGDELEYINKTLYINGVAQEKVPHDGRIILKDMDKKYLDERMDFDFFKVQTGDVEHVIQIDKNQGDWNNFDPSIFNGEYKITVPKDQYVVIGDNRDYSADSRSWGFVPFKHIKGSAQAVWFAVNLPFNFPWENIENPQYSFRPWRIGTVLK